MSTERADSADVTRRGQNPRGRRPGVAAAADSLRILVAADDAFAAGLMRRLLSAEGHTVRTAGSVGDAVRSAAAHEIDLLITDIALPDGTGFDLLRRLRALAGGAVIDGITLTGFGGEEPARLSADAGFAHHLVKPITFDMLARAIAELAAARKPPRG